jgi:hypothetical protein
VSDEAQPGSGSPLQFERVEFSTPSSGQTCGVCKTGITDTYFAVGGAVVCPTCKEKLTGSGSGRTAFLRAWLWGGAVALLGTIIWYAIIKISDAEWGLVAIAVGYGVGVAVRRGSRGRGGWKYQALAMFLTYASIVTSKVPFVIQGISEAAKDQHAAEKAKAGAGAADDGTPEAAAATRAEDAARAEQGKEKVGVGTVVLALLFVLGIAFAAPFMGGTSSLMGLVILAIALYEAWKLNRRIPVTGPFRVGAALASAGAPVGTP